MRSPYDVEDAIPPAPVRGVLLGCAICGNTRRVTDDIPCPACVEPPAVPHRFLGSIRGGTVRVVECGVGPRRVG